MNDELHPKEAALREIAANLAVGEWPTRAQHSQLRNHLKTYIQHRYTFPYFELDDIADESLTKFLLARAKGKIDPSRALAYLRTIAVNEAKDRLRKFKIRNEAALAWERSSDDDISALLDQTASAEIVASVMAELARGGDRVAVIVGQEFLNQAGESGAEPSARAIAEGCQMTHPTVSRALQRLRKALTDREADEDD